MSGTARHEPVPAAIRAAARCGNSVSMTCGSAKNAGAPVRQARTAGLSSVASSSVHCLVTSSGTSCRFTYRSTGRRGSVSARIASFTPTARRSQPASACATSATVTACDSSAASAASSAACRAASSTCCSADVSRMKYAQRSGSHASTTAPTSTGTRLPSLRWYSLRNGVQLPVARSSARAAWSAEAHSGGVIACQSTALAARSASPYPTSRRKAPFASVMPSVVTVTTAIRPDSTRRRSVTSAPSPGFRPPEPGSSPSPTRTAL